MRDHNDFENHLFFKQVRGYAADDMRAIQVAETASSLNSDDVFVLETPSKTYLWNGVVSLKIFKTERIVSFESKFTGIVWWRK